jgi:hypothetical protein
LLFCNEATTVEQPQGVEVKIGGMTHGMGNGMSDHATGVDVRVTPGVGSATTNASGSKVRNRSKVARRRHHFA